ncbi:DNA sulfur modification protein DndB [Fictibacillus nanhaiensis]|uniref:DNA sulfur modification protein DndB n=1 Tax=Fictibacillus nanhaiensis TaxID=742169 RepID=UPI002E1F0E2C|nr:DNA sulfur modification protein DndB [Fictibacillus nanhaiensis]
MIKEREILEENLIQVLDSIKTKRKLVNQIKEELSQYDIMHGETQGYIGNANEVVPELEVSILALLTEAVYKATKSHSIYPKEYFGESELKQARQYDASLERPSDQVTLPYTIEGATQVGNNAYLVTMDIREIYKFIPSLYYNFEVQREASYMRKNDEIIPTQTVNMQNVKEIAEHLKQGTLVPTVLVWNCATRTANSNLGEIVFNAKKMTIEIQSGTRIDIVDGYHRILGLQKALDLNPDLEFRFGILITNYSQKKTASYQAQLAKQTPISRTRVQELEANRFSDTVVQQLRDESDLKGKISQTHRIHSLNSEVVTYNVLADTIDEEFGKQMKTKMDALDVGDWLTKYFDYIVGSFPQQFIEDVPGSRKTSLVADNNFFIGYIVLARRMMTNNIDPSKIRDILKGIDFNRDNPKWKELGIVNEDNTLNNTNTIRKIIKKYFEEIDIN